MKMPAEPGEIEPWLSDGWVVAWEETGHLMAVDLVAPRPVAPDGYTATAGTTGAVTGEGADRGGAVCVHRVMAAEAHRRRGGGAFVMRTLAARAVEQGGVLGVLGAT